MTGPKRSFVENIHVVILSYFEMYVKVHFSLEHTTCHSKDPEICKKGPLDRSRINPNSKNRSVLKIANSRLFRTINFIESRRFLAILSRFSQKSDF